MVLWREDDKIVLPRSSDLLGIQSNANWRFLLFARLCSAWLRCCLW